MKNGVEVWIMRSVTTKRRGGTALVEFALVISVLLVIVFGIIEFGVYCSNSLRIANATREGARVAAVGKSVEEIRSRVQRFALPLVVPSAAIDLACSTDTLGTNYVPLTNDPSNPAANAAVPDHYVRVIVSVTNKPVTGALGALFGRTLRGQVVMRREGSN